MPAAAKQYADQMGRGVFRHLVRKGGFCILGAVDERSQKVVILISATHASPQDAELLFTVVQRA